MMLTSTLNAVVDLLWPPRCAGCFARLDARPVGVSIPFCDICASSLIRVESPRCTRCALPFDGDGPDHLCLECARIPPPFGRLEAVFEYGGAAADAVVRLKYGGATFLAGCLGKEMAALVDRSKRIDSVIPVPLHSKKILSRGFNQSALLAKVIASMIDVPLDTSSLVRIRDTSPQAGMSRKERLRNIRGAFYVKRNKHITGKRVLLVDDVVTTATTVREASRVLVRSGARRVDVAAFARAG
jgi:ComF family protein